jgi:undecaprenyl pyrophosphate synthase
VAPAHLARPTDAPSAAHESPSDADAGALPVIAAAEEPLLPPDEIPRHVAIIMDGNRRWARSRDLPELEGHAAGVEEGVRVRLLGRLDELPEATRASIGEALEATAGGERLLLNIAFNYAGRTEIVDALRQLVASGITPDRIDENAINAVLYTAGLPDPDLVIRTGGEQRLSNFLIWQSAYAEFYSCEALWPDFGPDAFDAALLEFARRHRRFGR